MLSLTPRPLYPGGRVSRYQLDRELVVPQSLSGRRELNPSHPPRSLTLYHGSVKTRLIMSLSYIFLTDDETTKLASPMENPVTELEERTVK
jgi:hypothetical protein